MKTTWNVWPPARIVWTDALSENVGGSTRRFTARIRPKYAPGAEGSENPNGDEGIIQHELQHVKQFWWLVLTLGLIQLFFDDWKLYREASAYAVQLEYLDRHGIRMELEDAARRLMDPWYGFGFVVVQDAAVEITKWR